MRWVAVLAVASAVALCGSHVLNTDGQGELWAVLVAGSATWMNYRHQADVCHAYQILHQHGVPDDHIIVMMEDDIANSRANPKPGVVINRPDGPNVYEGVPKDYTGMDVTPENFLKVLSGDAAGLQGVGSGKVLKSGPNDRVFVNLVDHGAPGIFGFPRSFLHARNFSDAILAMHRNKQYKEMVIYLESCESGSMFQNLLPDDIDVYALSAANATQPSYACYMDEHLHTFLGDVFSIKWMEDTDREDITKESLEKQFHLVKKEVNVSHVMQWGDKTMAQEMASNFLGSKEAELSDFGPFPTFNDPCLKTSIDSTNVSVAIIQGRMDAAQNETEASYWAQQMVQLHQNRTWVTETMHRVALSVTGSEDAATRMMSDRHHTVTRWLCYEESVEAFHRHCFNLGENPYALRVLQPVMNLCEHGYTGAEFASAARAVCTHASVSGIV
ncbi:legumain-like [Penaeus chinensis]|uniref:legumain-like n=1 Tax=Penaeus chinensis TaxID=139456 RepID=UPI001FB7DC68|nr:legumain-like [Penaeus chinensis]XP_047493361.1 legumain-like [Penaeus chinensis]